jgi:ribosomal 50S subunit-recycling heat shock protein
LRLDVFLSKTRIIRQRPKAKTACDAGSVSVNGMTAKPSRDVSPGDKIKVETRRKRLIVEVLELPSKNVKKSDAATFYHVIEDTNLL